MREEMAYQALYRKFRPTEFEDVKGQEHIVSTLKNQIVMNRIGHAYLLCGTRGTGKTTIAKLFAKAVNCEQPIDGSPCNTCSMCKSIQAQTSLNVIEIDAASNNGVDNIREINEEVQYSPTEGKYKVYIIDEVHMLSIGAFNALLKTLEEPPAYVIFILATTESHKVPITILSRCQRYDLRRISVETISNRLFDLIQREQIQVEEKAVKYIAKLADGSMRDALSLLEQCISFHIEETLTYNNVLEILGAVDVEIFEQLLNHISNEDVENCILKLDEIIMSGKELGQFVNDFIWHMRNILLIQNSEGNVDLIDISTDNIQVLKEQSKKLSQETLMRFIRVFSELAGQIRNSTQKRVLIEVALIKLCKPQMEKKEDTILERIEKLEKLYEKGIPANIVQTNAIAETSANHGEGKVAAPAMPKMPVALPEQIKQVVDGWQMVVARAEGSIKHILSHAYAKAGDKNVLILAFEEFTQFGLLNKPDKIQWLEEFISKQFGAQIQVKLQMLEKDDESRSDFVSLVSKLDYDVEFEE